MSSLNNSADKIASSVSFPKYVTALTTAFQNALLNKDDPEWEQKAQQAIVDFIEIVGRRVHEHSRETIKPKVISAQAFNYAVSTVAKILQLNDITYKHDADTEEQIKAIDISPEDKKALTAMRAAVKAGELDKSIVEGTKAKHENRVLAAKILRDLSPQYIR